MFGHRPKLPQITPQLGTILRQEAGLQQPETSPAPAKKPGLFGQGGAARSIAGLVGDVLLQRGGHAPIYAPTMQRQQLLAEQQRQASLARETDWQDWVRKEQWKRDNPEASAPDAFERAMAGAGIDPAGAQGQQLYRQRAESMARDPNDEFVVVPIPGRGTYAGPRSGLPDAMGVPTAPVGRLTPISTPQAQSGPPGGNFMTAAQYQAIVNARGAQAADAWRRQHNIEVR